MLTLGACVDQHYSITAYCGACRAGRRVDLLALIVAFGEHASVEALWERPGFRCARLGHGRARGVAIGVDAPSYRCVLALGALAQAPPAGPMKSPRPGGS